MPIENDIESLPKETIYTTESTAASVLKNYQRNCFLIETKDREEGIRFFKLLYNLLEVKEGDQEPMMNIITWYNNDIWYSCIFPREKHRPACFFAEGEENLLISPASVDLGGVFITPLEKDFEKITKEDISLILKEICIDSQQMQSITDKIKQSVWNQK